MQMVEKAPKPILAALVNDLRSDHLQQFLHKRSTEVLRATYLLVF